jgi:hypothetical protein
MSLVSAFAVQESPPVRAIPARKGGLDADLHRVGDRNSPLASDSSAQPHVVRQVTTIMAMDDTLNASLVPGFGFAPCASANPLY